MSSLKIGLNIYVISWLVVGTFNLEASLAQWRPPGVAGRVPCNVLLRKVVRSRNLRYDRPNIRRIDDGTPEAIRPRPATAGARRRADRAEPAQGAGAAGLPGGQPPGAQPRCSGDLAVARERWARGPRPPAPHPAPPDPGARRRHPGRRPRCHPPASHRRPLARLRRVP